ncbi:unnamed protein product, partial [Meganyctiphanes norvegica]
MASSNTLCLCTLVVVHFLTVIGKAPKIVVEPNDSVIKYVGESMSLGCCMMKSNSSRGSSTKQKQNSLSQLQDQEIILSKNWIIPTSHVHHVKIIESQVCINVTIDPLRETDGGNYTCEIKTHMKPVKTIVRVVVLPRGIVSHCKPSSFTCESGHCIPNRFSCDGYPDCPDGSDESNKFCGSDICADKLKCSDGRCLDYSVCCREPSQQPPNCTINPTISCCRQLVHPDSNFFHKTGQQKLYTVSEKRPYKLRACWIIQTGCII